VRARQGEARAPEVDALDVEPAELGAALADERAEAEPTAAGLLEKLLQDVFLYQSLDRHARAK
jgi:hypothetical protein